MNEPPYNYWPFDVAIPRARLPRFNRDLLELFDSSVALGRQACVNELGSLIGFRSSNRLIEFIHRGRNRYWEPLLNDEGHWFRLGPFFGLAKTKCIVVERIDGIRDLSTRWLDGLSIGQVMKGLSVFDRSSPTKPLQIMG